MNITRLGEPTFNIEGITTAQLSLIYALLHTISWDDDEDGYVLAAIKVVESIDESIEDGDLVSLDITGTEVGELSVGEV